MGGIDYIRKGEHQAALDRIRELEAELAYFRGFHDGVCKDGTHVVVPVEPTDAMLFAAKEWACGKYGRGIGYSDTAGVYRAMIRAAQENADG